jgi:hypothetical protein
MSQLQVTGEAKIRDIQGPVVANSGVVTALDGAASQYVRGDGTLADFPTSTGGGSSVSYYLNSSVSQGTIGGVAYRELSKEPIIGAGTDIAISANGYVANYLTDANDPDVLSIPGGNFNCEFYFSVNNNSGNPTFYAELYKYDGTTFTLLGTSAGVPESINQGTTIAPYYFAIPVATAALSVTDRLAIRIYVNVSGRTITLHTENGHLCQVVTTLSKGMVSLNNLTDQSQYLATGTSGTDFNIVSSVDTHTFNIPSASASNRGLITTGTQTIAGAKAFNDAISANYGIALLNGAIPPITTIYYAALSGNSTGLSITYRTGGGTNYTNNLNFPANNNSYLFPSASGTLALTTDISYPVTSVFGRTGAVVATEGDYSLTQLSDVTITTPTNGQVLKYNGTAWINDTDANTGTVTSVGLSSATSGVTIGSSPITTSGTITLAIATASGSQNGLLSSTDWTTFNNKQNSITLTTTGSSGAATLVGSTLNIPNYGSALSGYVTLDTTQTITGLKTFSNDITGQSNIYVTNQEGGVYADYFGRYSTGTTALNFIYGSTGSVVWNNGGAKMTLSSAGALSVVSSISATSATLNGNVIINSTATALSPLQVVATGTIVRLGEQSGTTGKQFLIGIDATSGRTELQSVWQGTSFTSLALQPSGGNVLIGTTGDNGARLQVSGTATFSSSIALSASNNFPAVGLLNRSSDNNLYMVAASSGFVLLDNSQNTMYNATPTSHTWQISNSPKMTLNSSGNVGIGVSPASVSKLQVKVATDINLSIRTAVDVSGAVVIQGISDSANDNIPIEYRATKHCFTVGNVLIGTTTDRGYRFQANSNSGTYAMEVRQNVSSASSIALSVTHEATSGTRNMIFFYSGGYGESGSITSGNTTTSYNTSSDYRLKKDLKDYNGLNLVSAIKTYDFEWEADNSRMYGVMAHELAEVIPYAVVGEKDGIDKNGKIIKQGVDYSKIVPILVKAIQQQQAQIEELRQIVAK